MLMGPLEVSALVMGFLIVLFVSVALMAFVGTIMWYVVGWVVEETASILDRWWDA